MHNNIKTKIVNDILKCCLDTQRVKIILICVKINVNSIQISHTQPSVITLMSTDLPVCQSHTQRVEIIVVRIKITILSESFSV
jgi:hypothetical protein